MANAREKDVWDFHAQQLIKYFGNTPPDHINVPLLKKWAEEHIGEGEILDFGCGVGLWRDIFNNYEYYVGCDQNSNMIEQAKLKWPEDTFIINSWAKLPFSNNRFDVIFTRAVLMHNSNEDKKHVLPELFRVLKPGGYYIASETTYTPKVYMERMPDKEWDPEYTDGLSFTPQGWVAQMYNYGLTLIEYAAPEAYLFIKE